MDISKYELRSMEMCTVVSTVGGTQGRRIYGVVLID